MSRWKGLLAVSGPDGSGKSVVIRSLSKGLQVTPDQPVRTVWLRYNHYLTRYVLALAKLLGFTRYQYKAGIRIGHHRFQRAPWLSILFMMTTWVDTLLISVFKVYLPVLLKKHTVICDRWVVDIMVDLELDTGIPFSTDPWLGHLFACLVPKGTPYVILLRDPDALKEARDENRVDSRLPQRLELYERWAADDRFTRIQNRGTIEETVHKIRHWSAGRL